jgi:hypothetical protein
MGEDLQTVYRMVVHRSEQDDVSPLLIEEVPE